MKDSNKSKKTILSSIFGSSSGNKIFAVLFAVIFWLYVMDQTNPEIIKLIEGKSITYRNLSAVSEKNLVITSIHPENVDVKLSGRRADLLKINKNNIILTCDTENLKEGSNTLYVKSSIDSPDASRVKIASLSTDKIIIEVDKMVSVSKAIAIEYTKEIPIDKFLEDVKPNVEKVFVNGPSNLVNKVAAVRAMVSSDEIIANGWVVVSLFPVDSKGSKVEGVSLSQNTVRVYSNVYDLVRLPVEVVFKGELKNGFELGEVKVVPGEVDIKLFKTVAETAGVPKSIKTVPIDISNITENYSAEVELATPAKLGVPVNNIKVRVEIQVKAKEGNKGSMKNKASQN